MKKESLPKGLREFEGSLCDDRFSGALVQRLLDLPENGLKPLADAHARAITAIRAAEDLLSRAKLDAARIALSAWVTAQKHWSVEELQVATGYTDE